MSRLDKFVAEVISSLKKKYPELEIKITPPTEDEDVDLEIYTPRDISLEVLDFAVDLVYKIQMEEGYDIIPLVIPYASAQEYAEIEHPSIKRRREKSWNL